MFFDYARYYLTFCLQLLTAAGLALGGHWAWLGLSTLFAFAVLDELVPNDLAERRMNSRTLASIPLWLCTLSGPLLVLVLRLSLHRSIFHEKSFADAEQAAFHFTLSLSACSAKLSGNLIKSTAKWFRFAVLVNNGADGGTRNFYYSGR